MDGDGSASTDPFYLVKDDIQASVRVPASQCSENDAFQFCTYLNHFKRAMSGKCAHDARLWT